MTRAGETLRSSHALLRSAYVLMLLSGLLGMHGLSHSQHGSTAGSAVLAAPQGHAHALTTLPHAAAARALPSEAVTLASGTSTVVPMESCDTGCGQTAAALCVALMTATALLPLALRQLRRTDPPPPVHDITRVRSAPMRGPPDPVSVLCVCRT